MSEINCNNYTRNSFCCNDGSQSRFKVLLMTLECFLVCNNGGLSFFFMTRTRERSRKKNRPEWFYFEMTVKCFAVGNNGGLFFIISWRALAKDREKFLTEWFYFEMTVEYFAVCNNSGLSFLIILPRAQKIEEKYLTKWFYFERTWDALQFVTIAVFPFSTISRCTRKRSRKDRTKCELIFDRFAVCNNGGVSEFP